MNRRGARGAVAVAILLALAGAPGCQKAEDAPVAAAKAFNAAVRRGDAKALLGLVDADAVAHIEGTAQAASDQVGGRRKVEPHEMLQVVDIDREFELQTAVLLDSDGETATVALEGTTGQRHILTLINQGGQWRVKLPLPERPGE